MLLRKEISETITFSWAYSGMRGYFQEVRLDKKLFQMKD